MVDVMLNDKIILKIMGKKDSKLIIYPNIHKYNSIEQLFENKKKILLLYVNEMKDDKNMSGHWTGIFRPQKNKIIFFDPYGLLIDSELNYYTKNFRKKTHQDKRYLTKLLYNFSLKKGNEVHYNELREQKLSDNINTCGRWVAVFGHFIDKMTLEKWQSIWKNLKKKGYNLDEVIVKISNQLNGKPIQ